MMRLTILTAIAFTAFGDAAVCGPPKEAVCALIDLDKVDRVGLLEAKLLADPSATWVERSSIDKILKEQKLQTAFGPQGGSERVRLGKLLKADLLVLIRSIRGAKEPTLEVVMCDTAQGLRLTVRAVAVTKDANADAAALLDAVALGLKKYREKVREVVSVPPFTSTNLEYKYDHLKGAYAKLVEQAALASPGVVVVELAEAEAIAQEIKIADPGSVLNRTPPLYLLGEFRHQKLGDDVQVAIKFRATRGGKLIGEQVEQTVAPEKASVQLHKWVGERLAAEKSTSLPALDSKAETKQLAQMSGALQRAGDWDDALALLEASLLLDPNQPELNADAMVLLNLQSSRLLAIRSREFQVLRRAAQIHCRGLEHIEALIRSGAKLPRFAAGPESVRGGRLFYSSFPFPSTPDHRIKPTTYDDPPEVRELIDDLLHEDRAAARRLLPIAVKDGVEHDVLLFISRQLRALTVTEMYAERTKLIIQYQEYPSMIAAAERLTTLSPETLGLAQLPIYRKMLDSLEKEGNPAVRAAAMRARQRLPEIEKAMIRYAERIESVKPDQIPKRPTPGILQKEEQAKEFDKWLQEGPLRKIQLKSLSPDDSNLNRLEGVVAAGSGVDVFWGHGIPLMVMKEKGQLKRLWEIPDSSHYAGACFDGRYLWITVEDIRRGIPSLFILDPVTEKVYKVTADDGLPQPEEALGRNLGSFQKLSLVLTELGPGRVCVAGAFGRSWVGIAQFDPKKQKATVKVIHEAREQPRQEDTAQELCMNRNLAFTPIYARTLRGKQGPDGKSSCRVLIGRGHIPLGINNNMAFFSSHPLVIDPDGLTVEVMRERLSPFFDRNTCVSADGSLLIVDRPPTNMDKLNLIRVEYPGTVRYLRSFTIPSSQRITAAGISNDRLNFTFASLLRSEGKSGYEYWSCDLDGKNLRKSTINALLIQKLANSTHYGLVAWSYNSLFEMKSGDVAPK